MNPTRLHLSIIGATGSIGTQCLDIVRHHPDRLGVLALAAHRSEDRLAELALEFRPKYVALADASRSRSLRTRLKGSGIQVFSGLEGVGECASLDEAGIVVGAASGVAGLYPVLRALEAGKVLALANKETLVAAGHLAMPAARRYGAEIIPVDSEHAAIFQCLEQGNRHVEKIILTASGGPFAQRDRSTFDAITPEEALKHPNWSMGRKVTIDSATLMNKGLEVIEARWLFDMGADRIDVVVHPQSIVHSMVVYTDGSVKAQLSQPDMRLPIQYALSYPERWPLPLGRIDWSRLQRLEFRPPDREAFPCLRLAYEAVEAKGNAPAILNAANEAAVALFLDGQLPFTGIPRVIERCLERLATGEELDYEALVEADQEARRLVGRLA
ncbi:MAG: 1-deoxy-D-xylulose-5-phosphate reductoisomerase [Bacteroidota bacterium]|nr:1-deoxy-D-xylulose-5-phosphate reductoisomerase [Bacteroidota bacterium]